MKKFFRPPPSDAGDFFDLFHAVWDQGIGNAVRADGLCGEKWTSESLSFAFEQSGMPVSERTIDSWHARVHVPGPENLRGLIGIVSDKVTRPAWRDALLKSARNSRAGRRREVLSDKTLPAPDAALPPASDAAAAKPLPQAPRNRLLRIAGIGVAALALAGAAGAAVSTYLSPRVSDLRFCDVQHFSVPERECSRNMERFDYGIRRVYVSFRIHNWPDDQPFVRTWYLNGASVLERQGLTAPPWEGWTWYGSANPEGADAVAVRPGLYTLRVRAGSAIRARTFEIATPPSADAGVRFRDPFHSGRGDGPEMMVLPAQPSADLKSGYRIAVSRSEITNSDWQACVEDAACPQLAPSHDADPSDPVAGVSWDEAFGYLVWLNGRLQIAPERWDRYTLLSAAEWEYVAAVSLAQSGAGELRGLQGPPKEWVLDCADPVASSEAGACLERRIMSGGEGGDVKARHDDRRTDTGFRVVRRLDPANPSQWATPGP